MARRDTARYGGVMRARVKAWRIAVIAVLCVSCFTFTGIASTQLRATATQEIEEIAVKGIRESIAKSIDTKRGAGPATFERNRVSAAVVDRGQYSSARRLVQLKKWLAGYRPFFLPAFAEVEQPNILWIIAEDLSARDLPVYGDPAAVTPNIDRLALEGTVFRNAFSTTPICSPSRSSLITGVHSTMIGAHNHRSHVGPKAPYQTGHTLPNPVRLIPELFQEAGYTTAIWGKTDYSFNWTNRYNINERISEKLDGWSELKSSQPFFAQIHLRETHRPWTGADKVVDRTKIHIPPIYPISDEIIENWGRYLDELATFDQKVGDILNRLKRDGLAENTVVMLFSDHGREQPRAKQWLYDGGIHVPLIVKRPNQDQLEPHSDALVSLVDVSATSLHLAGIKLPDYLDGRPLFGNNVVAREHIIATRDRDDETFDRVRAVRTAQYKYIRNFYPELPWTQYNHYIERDVDGQTHYELFGIMRDLHAQGRLNAAQALFWAPEKPAEELYDVVADPWETQNLATNPDYLDRLLDMRRRLDEWMEIQHPQLGWRDKGAVPEPDTRLFIIRQQPEDPTLVHVVTTVDDPNGGDCSLRVEYSTDGGRHWHRASIGPRVVADYGTPTVHHGDVRQIANIETDRIGANTVRFVWDTQDSRNGSGPLDQDSYDRVKLRVTQYDTEGQVRSFASTQGFVREFPRVVPNNAPFRLVF